MRCIHQRPSFPKGKAVLKHQQNKVDFNEFELSKFTSKYGPGYSAAVEAGLPQLQLVPVLVVV